MFELTYKEKYKLKQKRPLKYCKALYKIIKTEKYDIVHVHGSSSMMFLELFIAKLAGVKIRIAHCHNTKSNYERINKLCKPLFKRSYTDAFACGEEAGRWLFGKNKDFTIIQNGKDLKEYQYNEKIRSKVRKKYKINNEIVLGHVGFFGYQKNQEYLVEVFYELIKEGLNYKLVLLGDGQTMNEIREKIKKLELEDKVLMLGQIPLEDAAEWLSAMDIMVFPSRYEGFPNVLIEWQIAGLPCIISDKITKKVKLTNLVKFLSIEESPKVWAKEIEKTIIEDRTLNKEELSKKIREAGFDIKENAKVLEDKYIELIKNLNK